MTSSLATLVEWQRFVAANTHVFRVRPYLLFQQATCQPRATAPAMSAEARWRAGLEPRPRLRWLNPVEERDPCVMSLEGHTAMIVALAFSADGRYAFSAGRDDVITKWEVTAGRQQFSTRVPGLTASLGGRRIGNAAFSPDGTRLLIATDQSIVIRECESGALLRSLNGHAPAAWSPDGRTILAGTGETTNSLMGTYEVASGDTRLTLSQSGVFLACAFAPDGTRLLLSAFDKDRAKQLTLWNAETGEPLGTLVGHALGAWACAFAGDGSAIVTAEANDRGQLLVWNAQSRRSVFKAMNQTVAVINCALSPDGTHAAGIRGDGSVTVWNVRQNRIVAWLHPEAAQLWGLCPLASCAFSPDGKRVLVPSPETGTIRMFDIAALQQQEEPSRYPDERGTIKHLEFAPRDRHVLIWWHYERPGGSFAPTRDCVEVLDPATYKAIAHVDAASIDNYQGGDEIAACGYTKDGTQIFTLRRGNSGDVVRFFSAETFEALGAVPGASAPPRYTRSRHEPGELTATGIAAFVVCRNAGGTEEAAFVMRSNVTASVCRTDGRIVAGDSAGHLYFLQFEYPVDTRSPDVS